MYQIAAKIGGDTGVPPMNNSNASDGFPFSAQKRQLEDPGNVRFILLACIQNTRNSSQLSNRSCYFLIDQPESKKMATQSDIDSATALCK